VLPRSPECTVYSEKNRIKTALFTINSTRNFLEIKKILRCIFNRTVLKVWIGFISLYVGYRVGLFWNKTRTLFPYHRINILNAWKIIFMFAPCVNDN